MNPRALHRLRWCALATLAWPVMAPAATPEDIVHVAKAGASVRGRVVDVDTPEPQRDARVVFDGGSDRSGAYHLHTDAEGNFAITGLQPGEYEIRVDTEGGAELRTNLVVAGAESVSNLVLSVVAWGRRLGAVEGRVTNARGEPAPGHSVDHDLKMLREYLPMPYGGSTDEEGRYRIEYLAPGEQELRLNAYRPGWSDRTATTVVVAAGATVSNVNFTIYDGRLGGRCLDLNLQPVTGQFVVVGALDYHGAQTVRSDDSGRFSVSNLPPGRHMVNAFAGNRGSDMHWPWTFTVDLGPDETVDDLLFAPGPCEIRVAVREVDGRPVAGGLVQVQAALGSWRQRAGVSVMDIGSSGALDADGRAVVPHLQEARYSLFLDVRGLSYQWTHVAPSPSSPVELDVVVVRSAHLSGRVENSEGQGLARVLVRAESLVGNPVALASAITTEQGDYALGGMPPGTYRVVAVPGSGGFPSAAPVEAVAGTTSAVPLLVAGRHRGALRVRYAVMGEPMAPVFCSVRTPGGWMLPMTPPNVDGGDAQVISGLPDGEYQVSLPVLSNILVSNVTISGGSTATVHLSFGAVE